MAVENILMLTHIVMTRGICPAPVMLSHGQITSNLQIAFSERFRSMDRTEEKDSVL